jgi:hypothetical protein
MPNDDRRNRAARAESELSKRQRLADLARYGTSRRALLAITAGAASVPIATAAIAVSVTEAVDASPSPKAEIGPASLLGRDGTQQVRRGERSFSPMGSSARVGPASVIDSPGLHQRARTIEERPQPQPGTTTTTAPAPTTTTTAPRASTTTTAPRPTTTTTAPARPTAPPPATTTTAPAPTTTTTTAPRPTTTAPAPTTTTTAPAPTTTVPSRPSATTTTTAPRPTTTAPAPTTTTTTRPAPTTTTTTQPAPTTTTTTQPAPTTTTTTTAPPTTAPPASTDALRFAPPTLTNPTTVRPTNSSRTLQLDPNRDYIIEMPSSPLVGELGLKITGGRNVVLIGGEIHHPQWWPAGMASSNRGLFLVDQTGTVHVEGLYISGLLTEGIQLDQTKGARVQLQNIRVDRVVGSQDGNHADLLQTWSGPRELLIDGFSGSTTYQGFFLTPNQSYSGPPPERVEIHNVDISGTAESRYLYWSEGTFPITMSNVWATPSSSRVSNTDQFLWPKGTGVWSTVKIGDPPGGDLVTSGEAGIGYRSPGYR